jgi:hypothetical protein
MDYSSVEASMQAVLQTVSPLSPVQSRRVSALVAAVLLAGSIHISRLARMLRRRGQQDSRIRWITRLLDSAYLTQDRVYQPVFTWALTGYTASVWHLIIDRSTLWDSQTDVVTVALNYHKRAIPLLWQLAPFGGAPQQDYIALLRRCVPLVPSGVQVIVHGDAEFGSVAMILALRELGWDFILGQQANVHFRQRGDSTTRPFSSLPVPRHGTSLIPNIELTATHLLGGLNLMAFYEPKHNGPRRKRTYHYLVTSLPLHAALRRIGRRRWGIEPFHRDLKSAGFHITTSQLVQPARQQSLLLLVALAHLYAVCFGRWLCKVGRRREIDTRKKRHYSLFRLGWDWLIVQFRHQQPIPPMLRLYT